VAALWLVVAGPVNPSLDDAARALPLTDLGVYRGAADPEGVAEFGRWLGRDPTWALDYLPATSWKTIGDPSWIARRWSASPYKVVYSVPLLPDSGPATLERGAAGAYDHHFRRLARGLVEAGEGDAVVRLGWEFNGHWMRWAAAGQEAAFVEYWRNIVDAMRSVEGSSFVFDWCPSAGPNEAQAEEVYPGDAYVDVIGLDVYDLSADTSLSPAERWELLMTQAYGLEWHRRFAAGHGKPMSYPEWGLWPADDGGGGDSPYFIEQMHRWTATNNIVYQMYFDYDGSDGVRHALSNPEYENAAARYRELFGLPLPLYVHLH
jgi:hypothetical protein